MNPLVKVGGLGDVAGSLPRALRREGIDVRVALPFYASLRRGGLALERVCDTDVAWPGGPRRAAVWRTDVRSVPVYLVEHDEHFGREQVYGHGDDLDRFLFFCDALLAAAAQLGFDPDVVHAQDWHAAMVLSRLAGDSSHRWAECGRVYTIHNLALQGAFPRDWASRHGIREAQLAGRDGLAPDVGLSCMAQGIAHADRINTVSDTYAREILTPEYGAGLDGLLASRTGDVSGIVNGIDYEEFDPQTDPALVQHYSVDSLEMRAVNKLALQREAGLPERDDALVFCAVTRLFAQKGMDLVAEAFDALLGARDAQLIILGTGDESLHHALQQLEARHPSKMKLWLDFNPPLGQRIYAGCDCFLMPSRYEPCGLGQLISLRYGAVPIVRRTGGLSDTVADGETGFVFDGANASELAHACERALRLFADTPAWRAIQQRGMRQDWSWGRAAPRYVRLYEAAIATRSGALA
jgi:starch synthase